MEETLESVFSMMFSNLFSLAINFIISIKQRNHNALLHIASEIEHGNCIPFSLRSIAMVKMRMLLMFITTSDFVMIL